MHRVLKLIKKYLLRLFLSLKSWFYYKRNKIYIAKGSYIENGVSIGKYTRVNNPSYIAKCDIGAYCAIGGRLVVRSSNHRTNYINMQSWAQKRVINSNIDIAGQKKEDVVIGNAVWIGDSVIILPGARIGNGAVIGAGSVVTKHIPDFAIAVGNPAKVKKYRFEDDICNLLKSVEWWSWSTEKVQRNIIFFETDFSKVDYADAQEIIKEIR